MSVHEFQYVRDITRAVPRSVYAFQVLNSLMLAAQRSGLDCEFIEY
jgi:hypothetical protein